MMELKITPRKRCAEAVDPVLSRKRRLNNSDSSNSTSSIRITRVRFSTEQNLEQTEPSDIYQCLSDKECRDLRSQIWYTVRT
jgi:hypothetical protein